MTTSDDVLEQARRSERAILSDGIRLIRRQLRRAPRQFAIGGVGTILFAIMTVASSFVIGAVTDQVLLPAIDAGEVSTAAIVGAVLAIIGVSTLTATGISLRRIGAYSAQYHLQSRDRTDITDQYLALPIEWHRRHPTGQLLSNVNADVETASQIAGPIPMAFGVFVMLLITTALLFVTDVFLAMIGLLILPAIALTNLAFQRRMRVVAAEAQKLRAEVSEIAHESFDAALVVKTLGREDAEVGRFGARSDSLRDQMVAFGRLRAAFDPIMETLPTIGILAVVAIGAWRVDQGRITAGDLVTFAYLFRLVAMPMRVFAWLLGQIPAATVGWERIQRVLDTSGAVTYGPVELVDTGGAAAAANDVGYRYEVVEDVDLADQAPTDAATGRGVDSVSLDVAAGKTVALVGATGSGKSTIAQLLVRLYDPTTGTISLDGRGVVDLDHATLARSTALVFQEAFLFDDTVHANIALGEPYTTDEVQAAAELAQAHDFIAAMPDGYGTLVGERGAALSGGQRQRIALARALVRHPRLLVLDDATSAVDPTVESRILDALGTLDTTVIIVAYRRSSIVLADEVIFIEDGRVVGRGTHEQLYDAIGPYRALIDAYDADAAA